MFGKWLDEYQKLSQKTRFISQLAAFLLSLFSLLSLYDIVKFFSNNPQALESFIEESNLISSIIFQISIVIVFGVRFILTFVKKEKVFWINQTLWLIGFSLLAVYWYISRPVPGPFEMYSTFGPELFRHTSQYFGAFGIYYLVLSPIQRFIKLIYALLKFRRNKI